MSEMDDVLKEFLVESFENLDRLDHDFLALEERPDDRETLSRIFRAIHTVKGTCGFLGFSKLEGLTHVGETLLSKLRDGALTLDRGMIDALLAMADAVRKILKTIEETGADGDEDYAAMKSTLGAYAAGAAPVAETSPVPKFGEIGVERRLVTTEHVEDALEAQMQGDPRRVGEIMTAHGVIEPCDVAEIVKAQTAAAGKTGPSVAENSVRVDVGLLDRLMTLVGELVLARNQMLQFVRVRSDAKMSAAAQRVSLITTELQESVMKTRMQPVGGAWAKLPRIVRDLAQSLGKKIRLEMTGQDVELDRSIIEAIKDPLTHVVRNSCDHGIESPAERTAAGKPAEGRLAVRAYHEGGRVNLEIADDGGGVRAERVKAKALERGLIGVEQAARMSDRELRNLIFLPGFSTAEKITNVSGRGVGMDVVKTNIEHIGGTVDVLSVEGQGTTLKIRIPLTLAIVPALTVKVGGERYGIPQVNLLELVRLGPESTSSGARLESFQGASVFRLRGKLLPVVRLRDFVATPADVAEPEVRHVVVLRADERRFGLIVDDVCDTGEIVVKPLAARLKPLGIFAGATIMGDGGVVLILDVMGLAHAAKVVVEARRADGASASGETARTGASDESKSWLVTVAGGRRFALPLDAVARLEEFAAERFERAADTEVVQYRGDLLPIVRVRERFGMAPAESDAKSLPVVVCGSGAEAAGFVFDEVLDIVEERATLRCSGLRAGIAGAVVIQGKTADVLDVAALARATGS